MVYLAVYCAAVCLTILIYLAVRFGSISQRVSVRISALNVVQGYGSGSFNGPYSLPCGLLRSGVIENFLT